jgi:hypothetical protein
VNVDGKETVVKPGANWELTESTDLSEQVIATPAIAGNRIYIRTESHL